MVPQSDGCSLMKQMNSPHQQTPIRNNGLKLVYFRRKPELKQHKSTMCNQSKDLPIKLSEQDNNNHEQEQKQEQEHEQSPMKDPPIQIPETSSEGVSSAPPSVTIDDDSKCLQFDNSKKLSVENWEERYFLLQNFLKVVDQSTQDDYRQMLRSLSSVDLSRLAVELERRTIQLSMEEAKEVQRAKVLDVQGILDSNK